MRKRKIALGLGVTVVLLISFVMVGWFAAIRDDATIAFAHHASGGIDGVAFDRAVIRLSPNTRLVLPPGAVVRRWRHGYCSVRLAKFRGFAEVNQSYSVADARRIMGIACRQDVGRVVMIKYGEQFGPDGGASERLVVVLPVDV